MKQSIDTQLIHAGEPKPLIGGAVTMPIFQSAMFEDSDDELRYIRYNNTPNQQALNQKLAAIANAETALVTGSGMAAISTALLAVLQPGDHLLAQNGLYGGTHSFVTHTLTGLGIEVDFIDAEAPETWERQLRPTTRAIYVESISNPLMQVGDLEAVTTFAQMYGLVSLIDNTFPTPVNYRPTEWGFDLSLHSATKYLNGHSDIVAGVILGHATFVKKAWKKLKHFGGSLDPHACFLLHRGLKTLALRVRHQNESALQVARFLEAHPLVNTVNYPGLASHPQHARAARLFTGFGGMLSLEVHGGQEGAERFMQHLTLPILAPSLGGVESLATRPAVSSHADLSPDERQRIGITDGLIRVSIGIEATEDLIADFAQALDALETVTL